MVTDAEAHAADDKVKREEIETKNRGDALAYETEKSMKDLGEKMDGADKARVEGALETLKKALEGGGTDAIRSASEGLTTVWNEVSSKLYAEAAKGGHGGPGGGPEGPGGAPGESGGKKEGDDGAVDADYEVVK
jgi:molecular chaperone DnaK